MKVRVEFPSSLLFGRLTSVSNKEREQVKNDQLWPWMIRRRRRSERGTIERERLSEWWLFSGRGILAEARDCLKGGKGK